MECGLWRVEWRWETLCEASRLKIAILSTDQRYLGLALLRVEDATWLFVEVTAAGVGDFVELAFLPKLATSEPIKAAEVSQSDAHHRLLAGVVSLQESSNSYAPAPGSGMSLFTFLRHSH